jgi:cytochrome c peroxidase
VGVGPEQGGIREAKQSVRQSLGWHAAIATTMFVALAACSAPSGSDDERARQQLRSFIAQRGILPLAIVPAAPAAKVALGRSLFFDPIISGNRDQACATCHHPSQAMSDGRSLSVGTRAVVVDGVRLPGPDHTFTPRNSLALWDLGQRDGKPEVGGFWDRRVVAEDDRFVLYDVGYEQSEVPRLVLSQDLESLTAAIAMLPVLDRDEMRGEVGETAIDGTANELALILDSDFEGIWLALMKRLMSIDAYREAFAKVYPEIPLDELHFAHAGNAIAAFVHTEFQSVATPWDRFVAGDEDLDPAAVRGALLFFDTAGCANCHADNLLGDDMTYNYAVRPMTTGPKSDFESVDLGAGLRTNAGRDERYGFRTPSLRNVTHTGPWMHNGCYTSLEAVLRHKLAPIDALYAYDKAQLAAEFRSQVHARADVLADVADALSRDVPTAIPLGDAGVSDLLAFLHALSSPRSDSIMSLVPNTVPSGLDLVDP